MVQLPLSYISSHVTRCLLCCANSYDLELIVSSAAPLQKSSHVDRRNMREATVGPRLIHRVMTSSNSVRDEASTTQYKGHGSIVGGKLTWNVLLILCYVINCPKRKQNVEECTAKNGGSINRQAMHKLMTLSRDHDHMHQDHDRDRVWSANHRSTMALTAKMVSKLIIQCCCMNTDSAELLETFEKRRSYNSGFLFSTSQMLPGVDVDTNNYITTWELPMTFDVEVKEM